jgi:hypothetical protein
MNIDKYLDESHEIITLSQAQEIEAVRILLKATMNKRDEVRKTLETNPKHCPENLEEDLVFLLGMSKGLNFALELPESAQKQLNKLERRKK